MAVKIVFTHSITHRSVFTHDDAQAKEQRGGAWLCRILTHSGHGNDGLRRGVVLLLHPRVILVQELRQRRCLGQQLANHVAAYVGRLLQSQDVQDAGLDDVDAHLLTVLPEVADGTLVLAVHREQPGAVVALLRDSRRGGGCGCEQQKEEHP